MASEEKSFETVNGRKHGQKVITIAHPEHRSGELKTHSNKILFFLFLNKNICCWYSLEVPRGGTSNEYPQHMFFTEN